MIKILLFSTLLPSTARPIHGIFIETRRHELLKTGQVQTKVIAPVSWFPLKGKPFVATAGGTDFNLIPKQVYPRKLVLETAQVTHRMRPRRGSSISAMRVCSRPSKIPIL